LDVSGTVINILATNNVSNLANADEDESEEVGTLSIAVDIADGDDVIETSPQGISELTAK
jgi:hypothetical protein